MLIFAIDDDRLALRELRAAIGEAAPDAEIMDFHLGAEAVHAIEEWGLSPDVVFTDIQMPGLDGLRLAERLRQSLPSVRVVFVTARSEHALEAFRLHINGYILKPVTVERVREELLYNVPELMSPPDRLRVQCFGRFEVFWQGRPLMFQRRQTRELLAYLIDQEGAVCTAEEIAAALWENENDLSAMKTRLRQLVRDLKSALAGIGLEDALIRRRGQLGIQIDRVDCDYYRMLRGDMDAMNAFRGEYMSQYSWAKISEGNLYFRQS